MAAIVRYEATSPGTCSCMSLEVINSSGDLVKLELQTCPACVTIARKVLDHLLTSGEVIDMFTVSPDTSRSHVDEEDDDPYDLWTAGDCRRVSPPPT